MLGTPPRIANELVGAEVVLPVQWAPPPRHDWHPRGWDIASIPPPWRRPITGAAARVSLNASYGGM